MKVKSNKGLCKSAIVSIGSIVWMLLAVCLCGNAFSEVHAASALDTTTYAKYAFATYTGEEALEYVGKKAPEQEGYVFAGWFTNSKCRKDDAITSKDQVEDNGTYYAKFVSEDVLTVKAQLSEKDVNASTPEDERNMRFVSSVDSTNYQSVGFRLKYREGNDEQNPWVYKKNTATSVFKRIASYVEGDEYKYSSKVVDTKSEYFMTAIWKGTNNAGINVATDEVELNCYVRAYWVTGDGVTVYGPTRYISAKDGLSENIVNLSVKDTKGDWAEDAVLTASYTNNQGVTTNNLSTELYHDGSYAHLKIDLGDAIDKEAVLRSVTEFTITDGTTKKEALYRNLFTKYSGSGTEDRTWYDLYNTEDEFVVATAADLYGLANVVMKNDDVFTDKTVYMVSDITVNKGTADITGWAPNDGEEQYPWTKIGTYAHPFDGVFDGQGHTIEGVVLETAEAYNGLFGRTSADSTLKQFTLQNSYLAYTGTTAANFGGIVGLGAGTFENIKSEAFIVSSHINNGGILGKAEGTTTITGCWYSGTMSLNSTSAKNSGGIVGMIEEDIKVTMNQCLYDGVITGKATGTEAYGGLCGNLYGDAELQTKDCFVVGSVESDGNNFIGAIVGYIYGKEDGSTTATLRLSNTYIREDICTRAVRYRGYGAIYYEENAAVSTNINSTTYEKRVSLDDITGYTLWYNNYQKVDFDFDNTWCLADGTTPQLRKLADKEKILTTLKGEGTEANPWIVSEKEELIAFSDMAQDHDFSTKFVSVGTEKEAGTLTITINEGATVDEVKASNPTNWIPIGTSSLPFAGTFNGNGNTISGIYYKGSDTYVGLFGCIANSSTVKDLILSDTCYFESENSNTSTRIGSVAGCVQGTLDTIKSEATVVSIGHENGGIAGAVYYTGAASDSVKEVKFSNVWFSGTLTMTTAVGRMSGGIVGKIYAPNRDIVMEHCLVTGTIAAARTVSNSQLGGLIGQANDYRALTISDSLVGSVIQNVNIDTGAIIGTINETNAYTLQNVYGVDGNAVNGTTYDHGITGTNVPGTAKTGSVYGIADIETIKGYDAWYNNATVLGLDFEKNWCLVDKTTPQLRSFTDEADVLPMLEGQGTEVNPWLIANAEDLKNLSVISQKLDFAGKFVSVGAEEQAGTLTITINEGATVDEVKASNPTNWAPIGSSTLPFAGTFNGNGNTISGIYYKGSDTYVGLFGCIANSSTVKDLILSDTCYFESENSNTSTRIGSVAGCVQGTLDTIKSEATVISIGHENGGIAGAVYYTGAASDSVKKVKFSNVWFAGTLTMPTAVGRMSGGIVGKIYAPNRDIVMEHCLVTGTITAARTVSNSQLGGMIGQANDYRALTISDSLVGSVIQNVNIDTGAIIGTINETNAYTLQDVYGVEGKAVNGTTYNHGITGTNVPGTVKTGSVYGIAGIETIKGYDGWYNLTLDFDNYWVAVEDAVPELESFANTDKILATLRGQGTEANPWLIANAEDLKNLSVISKKLDFAGKFVSVGTEEQAGTLTITINEGATVDEVKASNPTNWIPIGTSSLPFAGTFNGNRNTISGIYYKGSDTYVGLFGCIANSSTVKDLILSDTCYFESENSNTSTRIGSVAGCVQGTLDTIKSEATVVSIGHENGGIAGAVYYTGAASDSVKEVKFSNVWFSGTLTMPTAVGRMSGGIVGKIYAPNRDIVMEHCLVTGTITAARTVSNSQLGGMIGQANDYRALTISDSLVGSVIQNVNIDTGAIIGTINETNAYTLQNVYGVDGKAVNGTTYEHGITGTNVPGTVKTGSVYGIAGIETIKGYDGWYNTTLDFDSYWVAIDGQTPELKAFSTSEALATWSGKGTESSPWIITTGEELTRLSTLSQTYTFEDKFIRLGKKADAGQLVIRVNEGDSIDEVKENATENWQPIGRSNYPFAGTFDGNGNTISGLYYQGDGTAIGMFTATGATATIKDFKLTNSYFESTYVYNDSGNNYTSIGSIAGLGYGTLEGIKSEAEVVCYYTYGGGLIGGTRGYDNLTIRDCWFDGTLRVEGEQGAICGGILGGTRKKDDGIVITVENCLNSGEIVISALNSGVARVGGICGYVDDNMTVTNCLNAKSFVTTRGRAAAIIGEAHNGADITLENIYAITGDADGTNDESQNEQPYGTYNQNEYCGYIASATETLPTATVTLLNDSWAKVSPENLAGENAKTSVANLFGEGTHWLVGDLYPVLNILGEQGAAIPTMAVANSASISTCALTGDGNFVTQVTNTTSDEYAAYLASLEDAGFEKYSENNITNTVASATYVKKKLILTATYFKNENRTSISYYEGPISEHLKYNESDVTATDVVTNTSLSMLEMFHYGNSFVIQLKNGHFIVSDGGLNDELIYLIEYLEELAGKTDGVQNIPVIEAWFISHAHGDHTGAFNSFWDTGKRELVNRVYVEGVYYSSPSDEYVLKECGCEAMDFGISKVVNCLLRTEEGAPTPLYRPQTGQRYYFNDTTIDILLAQEQLAFDGSDGVRSNLNSSSTVCLFTSENQTCLLSGDLQEEGFDILFANYDATMFSTLDFFALNHHGFNTSATIAKNITANTILKTVKDATPIRCKTAIETLCNKANESVAWGNGTVVFTFPYTPNVEQPSYTVLPNNSWAWKDSTEPKYHETNVRKEQPNINIGVDGTTEEEFE